MKTIFALAFVALISSCSTGGEGDKKGTVTFDNAPSGNVNVYVIDYSGDIKNNNDVITFITSGAGVTYIGLNLTPASPSSPITLTTTTSEPFTQSGTFLVMVTPYMGTEVRYYGKVNFQKGKARIDWNDGFNYTAGTGGDDGDNNSGYGFCFINTGSNIVCLEYETMAPNLSLQSQEQACTMSHGTFHTTKPSECDANDTGDGDGSGDGAFCLIEIPDFGELCVDYVNAPSEALSFIKLNCEFEGGEWFTTHPSNVECIDMNDLDDEDE